MKLALIRRRFAATGGAELYLQRLLTALHGEGHELHLYAESWDESSTDVVFHRVAVNGSRGARLLRFAEAVETKLATSNYDCVLSLERTGRQDVYRAGDGVHRVWLEQRRRFAPWWRKPFVRFGAFHRNMCALEKQTFDPTNTGRIIVNSEMVRREILSHFQFPEDRIHLVPNGVEVSRFQNGRRAETRQRFGVAEDEFLLLFVGSGWERKGLRFSLQATAQLESERVKLLVVGKGRQPTGVSRNVIFAGSISDVENAYAAADLLLFLPIYEPSANVVAEALASGLPVVTSVFNGAQHWIREGMNGSVIGDLANAQAVENAIRFWMVRKERRVTADFAALSLDRNVTETLAVLELAAQERLR